jgi:hypothetical protein
MATTYSQRRAPIVIRLLAVPVTAAVVLAGLWVTGAAITNDFALARTDAGHAVAGWVILGRARRARWICAARSVPLSIPIATR